MLVLVMLGLSSCAFAILFSNASSLALFLMLCGNDNYMCYLQSVSVHCSFLQLDEDFEGAKQEAASPIVTKEEVSLIKQSVQPQRLEQTRITTKMEVKTEVC